jgi:hypothetical protein
MTPEAIKQWQDIFRDLVITLVAAFMLIYETVYVVSPNPYVIAAGLTLLGAPAALRLDKVRRGKAGDAGDREDDPYDGPGGYFRS